MSIFTKMKEIGMKYCGEITCYSRMLNSDTIGGVFGYWYIHEFGGKCFVPYSSNGYHNRAAFMEG